MPPLSHPGWAGLGGVGVSFLLLSVMISRLILRCIQGRSDSEIFTALFKYDYAFAHFPFLGVQTSLVFVSGVPLGTPV